MSNAARANQLQARAQDRERQRRNAARRATAEAKMAAEAVATSPGPGMGYDNRCMTCDGRYCGQDCDGRPGYVWVVGIGWRSPEAATTWQMQGATVYWDDTADRLYA